MSRGGAGGALRDGVTHGRRDLGSEQLDGSEETIVRDRADRELEQEPVVVEDLVLEEDLRDEVLRRAESWKARSGSSELITDTALVRRLRRVRSAAAASTTAGVEAHPCEAVEGGPAGRPARRDRGRRPARARRARHGREARPRIRRRDPLRRDAGVDCPAGAPRGGAKTRAPARRRPRRQTDEARSTPARRAPPGPARPSGAVASHARPSPSCCEPRDSVADGAGHVRERLEDLRGQDAGRRRS